MPQTVPIAAFNMSVGGDFQKTLLLPPLRVVTHSRVPVINLLCAVFFFFFCEVSCMRPWTHFLRFFFSLHYGEHEAERDQEAAPPLPCTGFRNNSSWSSPSSPQLLFPPLSLRFSSINDEPSHCVLCFFRLREPAGSARPLGIFPPSFAHTRKSIKSQTRLRFACFALDGPAHSSDPAPQRSSRGMSDVNPPPR